MRACTASIFVVCWVVGSQSVFAQALIQKLPFDGTAVIYDALLKNSDPGSEVREMKGELTITVLSTQTRGAQSVREIELKQSFENVGSSQVTKFLVQDGQPNTKAVIGIESMGKNQVVIALDSRRAKGVLLYLSNPDRPPKKSGKEEIATGIGMLQTDLYVSQHEETDDSTGITYKDRVVSYACDETPLGSASWWFKSTITRGETLLGTAEMRLVLKSSTESTVDSQSTKRSIDGTKD